MLVLPSPQREGTMRPKSRPRRASSSVARALGGELGGVSVFIDSAWISRIRSPSAA